MINDNPPTGEEARAQKRETSMPLIWSGMAVLLVIAYVTAFLVGHNPIGGASHPVVAPTEAPAPKA